MPKLRQLVSDTAEARIAGVDGDDLVIVFNRRFITPRMQQMQIESMQEKPDEQLKFLLEFMSQCVVSWNLDDDDGNRVGLSTEALRDIPTSLLMQVLQAVTEALVPNPLPINGSSNGLSVVENLENVPIGIQ